MEGTIKMLLVLLVTEEGFVGIEAFNLQEPLICIMIHINKFQTGIKGLNLSSLFLRILIEPVYLIVNIHRFHDWYLIHELGFASKYRSGIQRIVQIFFPRVPFLTTDALPGGIPGVVGGTAILPIVLMVADQMAANSGVAQNFRHRIIEGFQRPPAAVQEIGAAGM